jgi:hypothetical protein
MFLARPTWQGRAPVAGIMRRRTSVRRTGARLSRQSGISDAPTHLFSDWFDIAAAKGRTRSDYLGLARQAALDAARDAGFETRVLDLPMIGGVLWSSGAASDPLADEFQRTPQS